MLYCILFIRVSLISVSLRLECTAPSLSVLYTDSIHRSCTASTITTRAGGVKVTQELYIIYNSVFMLWFTVCKNTTNTSRKCSDDPWKTPGSASAHDWLEILMLPTSRWDVWLCLHTHVHTSRQKHLVHKTQLKMFEHLVVYANSAGKRLRVLKKNIQWLTLTWSWTVVSGSVASWRDGEDEMWSDTRCRNVGVSTNCSVSECNQLYITEFIKPKCFS